MSPEWNRTCASCKEWQYNENGTIVRRGGPNGEPQRRHPNQPTPCNQCPKIPLDAPAKTPEFAIEPDERTAATLQHFYESRVAGFIAGHAEDPIVRRNAALIQNQLEEIQRIEMRELFLKSSLQNSARAAVENMPPETINGR